MSATLVELEAHPGLEHVRRYTPTGVTAQRWAVVESRARPAVARPGQDDIDPGHRHGRCGRGSKLDDDDRAELTKLLRERSSRWPVSRSRCRSGRSAPRLRRSRCSGWRTRRIGCAYTYPAVVEFLDAVDGDRHADRKTGSHRYRTELDEAARPGPEEIAGLLAVSAIDPLSLSQAGRRGARHRHRRD